MAKPLGPKSLLIRKAIEALPDKGNTEHAALLSAAPERKTDKIKVTAQDVAAQKQAMKKLGIAKASGAAAVPAPAAKLAGNGRRKPGRKSGRNAAATAPAAAPRPTAAAYGSPVDLI